MARADTDFAVKTRGLGALNRSLGKIDKNMRRESVGKLRTIAKKVRGTAQVLAPKGTRPKPQGVHRLSTGLRYSASNRGAAITSVAPHGGVFEYGGTIQPRGVPIVIPETAYVRKAIVKDARNIEEQIGDLFDDLVRRNGFR